MMEKGVLILNLGHAVLAARDSEECQRALAALAEADFTAANLMAHILIRVSPGSEPLWAAILSTAREKMQDFPTQRCDGLPAALPPATPFAYGDDDGADTASAIDQHLQDGRHETPI